MSIKAGTQSKTPHPRSNAAAPAESNFLSEEVQADVIAGAVECSVTGVQQRVKEGKVTDEFADFDSDGDKDLRDITAFMNRLGRSDEDLQPDCSLADWNDDGQTGPREIRELSARSEEAYVPPSWFAIVHAGLDERDRMFDWFDRACQERDLHLLYTLTDPRLTPMRSDPRFADLLRRVGLPPGKDNP